MTETAIGAFRRVVVACGLIAAFYAGAAVAQPAPNNNQDYVACMGGESAQQDPQRSAYCKCVHDEIVKWDENTLKNVAAEAQKSGSAATPQLEAVAQACINKVMK